MLCGPPVSDEVLNVEVLPVSVAEPSKIAPSRKFTVPPGAPTVDVTVEVNVTDCEYEEGFGAAVILVAVGAGFTVCVKIADVEGARLVVPT